MSRGESVFLCGMPRSASTWLGRALASHPDIGVFGESDYWGRAFVEPQAAGDYDEGQVRRVVDIQASKDWAPTTGDEGGDLPGLRAGRYGELVAAAAARVALPVAPQRLYEEICRVVASELDTDIVVDKTPGHLLFWERIREHFPGNPLIAVSREPFGFVASLTHRREGRGILDEPLLRRLAYHPVLTVILWRRYARALMTLRRRSDERILLVEYADIVRDASDVIRRICEHLDVAPDGIGPDTGPVNSSFRGTRRSEPPAATGYWLACLARREWRALYPEVESPGSSLLDVLLSWLLLAPGVLMFLLYAPRPAHWFRYLAHILGLRGSPSDRGGTP